jgi:tetratricopeptide (TPR) repeat protein
MQNIIDEFGHDGCQVEVLACATTGGDLRQVERRLNEVLEYRPDAISVIFGHNLYVKNDGYAQVSPVDSILAQSALLSRVTGRRPSEFGRGAVWNDPAQRVPALHEALLRFGATAKANGVKLVVSTMTSNLRFAPMLPSDTSDDARFLDARFHLAAGRTEDALRALAAFPLDPPDPLVEYTMASILYRAGQKDESREHFWRALEADPFRNRATRAVNETIRKAGQEAGFLVRDTVAARTAEAPAGIPGWETMRDLCHLRSPMLWHEVEALVPLYGQPVTCNGLRHPHSVPEIIAEESEHAAARRRDEGYSDVMSQFTWSSQKYRDSWAIELGELVEEECARQPAEVDREVDKFVLDSDRFAHMDSDGREAVLVGLARGYWLGRRMDRALTMNERARSLAASPSAVAGAWIQLGEWRLGEHDEAGARAAWQRAHELAPERKDATFFLSRL